MIGPEAQAVSVARGRALLGAGKHLFARLLMLQPARGEFRPLKDQIKAVTLTLIHLIKNGWLNCRMIGQA